MQEFFNKYEFAFLLILKPISAKVLQLEVYVSKEISQNYIEKDNKTKEKLTEKIRSLFENK